MTVTESRNIYLKKALIRFLKENNCYKQFIKYINKNNYGIYYINNLLSFHAHFIKDAFQIENTYEGRYFWEKMSLLWDACRIVIKEELITEGFPCYMYYNKINFNAARIVLKYSNIIKLRLLYEKIMFNIKYKRKLKKIYYERKNII